MLNLIHFCTIQATSHTLASPMLLKYLNFWWLNAYEYKSFDCLKLKAHSADFPKQNKPNLAASQVKQMRCVVSTKVQA